MKTNVAWVTLLVITLLSSSACFLDFDDDDDFFGCVRGSGPIETRILDLPALEGIELDISAQVIVRQGSPQEIKVEGEANVIDELKTKVTRGIWEIDFDRCMLRHESLKIYVTLPEFTTLKMTSSGTITSENILETRLMDIDITGSGDMDLAIDCEELDVRITGSGDLVLEGTADGVNCEITGSGDVRAFDLESKDVDIRITGSGDAQLRVSDHLDVRISGSGDVYYKGEPLINVNISGSGRVVNAN